MNLKSQAKQCIDQKDWDGAIDIYNKIIKQEPNNADAYNNRGIAYHEKKEYDKAIEDFNQALKINPDFAEAYNNRGNAYHEKKEYDKAIEDFNQALKINPDYAKAYNNRGIAYGHKKEYDKAIHDFNQTLKFNPNYPEAYNNRGNAYLEKKEYDKAIHDYDEALRIKPDFKEAIHNRAITLAMKASEKEKKDFKEELEKKVTNQQNEYFKKSSELLVSTKIDEERKKEYQKKLGETEREINSLLKTIKYFGVLLYGLIFSMFFLFLTMPLWSAFFCFPKFDFEPWSFIPLTFIAGLCLSPLFLELRMKSRQMNYWLALLEDASTKINLATFINTTEYGSDKRQELMLKYFEHFERHDTSDLIAGWGKNNKSNPTNNVNGFVDGVRKGGQSEGG